MEILIWLGSLCALAGLAGLMGCIVMAAKAKRQKLEDTEMRARLQKIVLWNMCALFLSAIGLAMVVVGMLLG